MKTQAGVCMAEDPDDGFESLGLGCIVLLIIVLLIALWIGLNWPSHNFMQSMGGYSV